MCVEFSPSEVHAAHIALDFQMGEDMVMVMMTMPDIKVMIIAVVAVVVAAVDVLVAAKTLLDDHRWKK